MEFLNEEEILQAGGKFRKIEKISFLPRNENKPDKKGSNIVNNRVMITGEIPRVTEFEKGFPLQYKEKNEFELVPDPLVKDDQALVMNIKDNGLLILTGCGHAGIINTIKYSKKVTGVSKIYSVLGGFHLSGQ
jgi:7,8-dihydropterin-6-yl-methyl-4-(beta-D-ribofuranosyl)aminobenzene 5'-phosphate synthase